MSYHNELTKVYHSTLYKHYMPASIQAWNWVIDRFAYNFGDIFSTISKDSLILDVACGVGYLEHYLLRNGFSKIHAVDISQEQIEVAKQKLKQHGLDYNSKVDFEIVDAFVHLRKTHNYYNVIVMIDLIEHFPKDRIMELLHLSHEALRNGGFLLLRTVNAENPMFGRFYHDFSHETPFTHRSMQQCLSLAGFKAININYEKVPIMKGKFQSIKRLKRFVQFLGLILLGKLLGMTADAFSQDLVAVAKK